MLPVKTGKKTGNFGKKHRNNTDSKNPVKTGKILMISKDEIV